MLNVKQVQKEIELFLDVSANTRELIKSVRGDIIPSEETIVSDKLCALRKNLNNLQKWLKSNCTNNAEVNKNKRYKRLRKKLLNTQYRLLNSTDYIVADDEVYTFDPNVNTLNWVPIKPGDMLCGSKWDVQQMPIRRNKTKKLEENK